MARARGANAVMAAAFEATYGVTPGTGFRKLPFVSANLGEEQSLIESDLLGYGRDPLTPAYDVVSNESDIVVPMDHRNIGFWLKALFGNPTTAASVAATLDEKLSRQKRQKELEGKRNQLRRRIFDRQDEIDTQRGRLIDDLESRLQQRHEVRRQFAVQWQLD